MELVWIGLVVLWVAVFSECDSMQKHRTYEACLATHTVQECKELKP